jgi:ABC-type branched-subunit amino acid transport system substrate-binding protein
MRTTTKIAVILVLVAVLLAVVSSFLWVKEEPKEIRFGCALSLSGDLEEEGQLTKEGYELWKDHVNSLGGITIGNDRYLVDIRYYDDESDPHETASLVEKLITEDKVDFLLGPYGSSSTFEAAAVAEKYRVLMVEGEGAAEKIFAQGFKYTFGLLSPAADYFKNILEGAASLDQKPNKVVILSTDDLGTLSVAEGAKQHAEHLGFGAIPIITFEKGDDLSPILSDLKDDDPNMVLLCARIGDSLSFVRTAKAVGLNPEMFGIIVAPFDPAFVEQLGKDADYIFGPCQWTSDLPYDGPVFGRSEDYARLFRDMFGKEPGYHSAAATACGVAYQLALEKASSLNREDVRDALVSLDAMTFYGRIKFNEQGMDIYNPMVAIQVQRGKRVTVWPEHLATGSAIYPTPPWEEREPGLKEEMYRLDEDSGGYLEKIDNIRNLCIVSIDDNVYKAEYEAGFIQGKLEKEQILSARDNLWDTAFFTHPTPTFPKQIPPTKKELSDAQKVLVNNYNYTLDYIQRQTDPTLRKNLQRLLYRLIGIYHGTKLDVPASLNFDERWIPPADYFSTAEMTLGYEAPSLSFMDVYFVNAFHSMFHVLSEEHSSKCSAFVKKTDSDIFIAHNSWGGFLDQSMAASFYINGDFFTVNSLFPGYLGSNTDFGYNNKGIMFDETTHYSTFTQPKTHSLWMFWRAMLAEQFASSLDEFYNYLSLEASGLYMNGYMVVDTKTREIGVVEMSYQSFVYFKPDGENGYQVITKPDGLSKEYDHELLQPEYILGINFPVSYLIRDELKSIEDRPARRRQFLAQIANVNDIESAKALIAYTEPDEPLSIYGRWDLGYGDTPTPKTVPDGSLDAKAVSASMTSYVSGLNGTLDLESPNHCFWMKFGTPVINGKPFIWSESQWKGQKLRDVPDSVDGEWNLLHTYIK